MLCKLCQAKYIDEGLLCPLCRRTLAALRPLNARRKMLLYQCIDDVQREVDHQEDLEVQMTASRGLI